MSGQVAITLLWAILEIALMWSLFGPAVATASLMLIAGAYWFGRMDEGFAREDSL